MSRFSGGPKSTQRSVAHDNIRINEANTSGRDKSCGQSLATPSDRAPETLSGPHAIKAHAFDDRESISAPLRPETEVAKYINMPESANERQTPIGATQQQETAANKQRLGEAITRPALTTTIQNNCNQQADQSSLLPESGSNSIPISSKLPANNSAIPAKPQDDHDDGGGGGGGNQKEGERRDIASQTSRAAQKELDDHEKPANAASQESANNTNGRSKTEAVRAIQSLATNSASRRRRRKRKTGKGIAIWPLGKRTISHLVVAHRQEPQAHINSNSWASYINNNTNSHKRTNNGCGKEAEAEVDKLAASNTKRNNDTNKSKGELAKEHNAGPRRRLAHDLVSYGDCEDVLGPHLASFTNFHCLHLRSQQQDQFGLHQQACLRYHDDFYDDDDDDFCDDDKEQPPMSEPNKQPAATQLPPTTRRQPDRSAPLTNYCQQRRQFGEPFEWPTAGWIYNATKPEKINLNSETPVTFKGKSRKFAHHLALSFAFASVLACLSIRPFRSLPVLYLYIFVGFWVK